jgi:hypothetical protein
VQVRNMGRPGVGMMAIAAVDVALWDLEARLLGLPLVHLLPARLDSARKAIGDGVELFVDANGAFSPRAALGWAERYRREWDVHWFEEPVSSGDLAGMGYVRDHAPGASTSRPGSTPLYSRTSSTCSNRSGSTAFRPTSPGAGVSAGCCRSTGWPQPTTSTAPGTVRPHSVPMPSVPSAGCAIWSTSTTTCDRAHALRRRPGAAPRAVAPGHGPPGVGPRVEGTGRRAVPGLTPALAFAGTGTFNSGVAARIFEPR